MVLPIQIYAKYDQDAYKQMPMIDINVETKTLMFLADS